MVAMQKQAVRKAPLKTLCRHCRARQLATQRPQRSSFHTSRAKQDQGLDTVTYPFKSSQSAERGSSYIESPFHKGVKSAEKKDGSDLRPTRQSIVVEREPSPEARKPLPPVVNPSPEPTVKKSLSDIIAGYITPTETFSSIINPKARPTFQRAPALDLSKSPARYGPVSGRMVRVDKDRGTDVARAFGKLNQVIALNGVKREFSKQKFHERPGMKRKRLKSLRWREQFKTGFFAMLQRSRELKRMGW